MKDITDKVAFITGGASGVGLGMAKVFTRAGMKVVIADIRRDFLKQALPQLRGEVHAIQLDITDREAMQNAAQETVDIFGKVHILCNNAGINLFKTIDESSYEDWDWVINCNLNGVFNGVHAFLPHIRAHGEGGHIVNTASMGAFCPGATVGIYTTTKFAVRGMSESLRLSLGQHNIGVSILCPGLVKSRIYQSEELRPESLTRPGHTVDKDMINLLAGMHKLGMDPVEVGEKVLRGIQNNDLYIFSHPDHKEEVKMLCEDIIAAFPDEIPDPKRMEIEYRRREMAANSRKIADTIE